MSKALSIIIPTYNMEVLFPRCLGSLISEPTDSRIEVMVVNDALDDQSAYSHEVRTSGGN